MNVHEKQITDTCELHECDLINGKHLSHRIIVNLLTLKKALIKVDTI